VAPGYGGGGAEPVLDVFNVKAPIVVAVGWVEAAENIVLVEVVAPAPPNVKPVVDVVVVAVNAPPPRFRPVVGVGADRPGNENPELGVAVIVAVLAVGLGPNPANPPLAGVVALNIDVPSAVCAVVATPVLPSCGVGSVIAPSCGAGEEPNEKPPVLACGIVAATFPMKPVLGGF